ncbi:MAG: hypothetical protein V1817_04530 [Candidatus Micrarchaeota archaeon]
MDLSADLGFAWNFGRNRERVGLYLLFFLGALAAFGVLALLLVALFAGAGFSGGLPSLLNSPGAVFAAIGGILLFALLLLALFLVFLGFWLWLSAGIIKNAASEYSGERLSLRECLDYAKTRFWTLVLLTILVAAVSFIVEFPLQILELLPFIGLLFLVIAFFVRLILQLGFIFASYEAVVAGENAVDSVKKSFDLFLKNPLEVLLVAVILVVALIVLLVLSVIAPFLIAAVAVGAYSALPASAGLAVAIALGVIALIVFLAEIAFILVFIDGFLTSAFLDLNAQTRAASAAPLPRPARAATAPRKRVAPVRKKR